MRRLVNGSSSEKETVCPCRGFCLCEVESGQVPARPEKGEPQHYHLDFGFAFTTSADIGRLQTSGIIGAGWYSLDIAECLVGPRIGRALGAPTDVG